MALTGKAEVEMERLFLTLFSSLTEEEVFFLLLTSYSLLDESSPTSDIFMSKYSVHNKLTVLKARTQTYR